MVGIKIGDGIVWDGQCYVLSRITPHVNRLGKKTSIWAWRARCPDCESEFEVTSYPDALPGVSAKVPRRCRVCRVVKMRKPVTAIGRRNRARYLESSAGATGRKRKA